MVLFHASAVAVTLHMAPRTLWAISTCGTQMNMSAGFHSVTAADAPMYLLRRELCSLSGVVDGKIQPHEGASLGFTCQSCTSSAGPSGGRRPRGSTSRTSLWAWSPPQAYWDLFTGERITVSSAQCLGSRRGRRYRHASGCHVCYGTLHNMANHPSICGPMTASATRPCLTGTKRPQEITLLGFNVHAIEHNAGSPG